MIAGILKGEKWKVEILRGRRAKRGEELSSPATPPPYCRFRDWQKVYIRGGVVCLCVSECVVA